ncbi:MAG: TlpA family protein disulfide reductase [Proteobacteria bacterium]|jgi:thiol-disulfide isomerase/thioredoxin|nr:TlpA family protein disulfide reductase [Pseudomonadota bacterium]
MYFLLFLATAFATEGDAGWVEYLFGTQRYDEAAMLAEQLLQDNPDDLPTHRMYARVRGTGMREGGVVEAEYRAWLSQAPDNDVRKVALAQVLIERAGEEACEEVGQLLMPLPAKPKVAWEAISALHRAKRDDTCPPQPTAKQEEEIRGKAGAHPGIPRKLDDAAADAFRDLWAEEPRRIGTAMWLWKGHYDGPALERAQLEALEAMDRITAGDDVPAIRKVAFAAMNGGSATYPKIEPAQARLDILDPGWAPHRMPSGAEYGAMMALWEANSHIDPQHALGRLDALAVTFPTEGTMRVGLEYFRGERLKELGRDKEWIDALERGWRAAPEDGHTAYSFAYQAHDHGTSLVEALEAVESGIATLEQTRHKPQEWPWLVSYGAWLKAHTEQANNLRQLRTGILHKIGKEEGSKEGVAKSEVPLMDAQHHLDVGMATEGHEAARHLVRAAVMTDDSAIREAAIATLDKRKVWFLAGLDAHLAAWLSTDTSTAWPMAFTTSVIEDTDQTGSHFPDVSFEVDGKTCRLSDYTGLRVVEVWATWCLPCVPGLVELDAVAAEYDGRGVTVIALGTDGERQAIDNALEGTSLNLIVGWAADGMDQTDTVSIPTVYVLDTDGMVLDTMHGLVEINERIRTSLDAALSKTVP